MWSNILKDLGNCVILYLPAGMAAGMLSILLLLMKQKICSEKIMKEKLVFYFLMVTYLVCIVEIALLSREPGTRNRIDLALFSTWGTDSTSHAYVVENIIMFLPFGILLSHYLKKKCHWFQCLLTGGAVSLFIETTQLITQRGYFQLDDIVTNMLGTIAGYILYKLFRYLFGKIRKMSADKEYHGA